MKTLVIYFSQTGNTRKIAQCIHDGLTAGNAESELKALSDISANTLSDYDLVGIGAPVFYYKEPFNVRDFLQLLPQLNGQHWFVFCTHGNVIGNFFPSVADKLKAKGAAVIGYHNCYANITVPFYPKPSYTSGHPDDRDLERAGKFGRAIVEKSKQLLQKEDTVLPDPLPVSSDEWIEESHRITEALLKAMLPQLQFNADTCTHCHACEEQCPVNGIDISSEQPRLQSPCIFCWRCVNICPTLSIFADWHPLIAGAPANYARYKKELDKATAQGEFRWLVQPEAVDVNRPFWKQREEKLRTKLDKPQKIQKVERPPSI